MSTANRISRRYWYDHRVTAIWTMGLGLVAWRACVVATGEPPPAHLEEGTFDVRRVVDGDTLVLASGARVRLQGIDCPETVKPDSPVEPWGQEASNFTNEFMRRANYRVRLSFGPERKDQYDRVLAFVWDGEVLLNEQLVRAGLARAKLGYRYSGRMKQRLSAAEREARRAGRGIWSTSGILPAGVE